MSVTGDGSGWPVYKGESFDLWEPDSGVYYGRRDPAEVVPVLQAAAARRRGPPVRVLGMSTRMWPLTCRLFPAMHPRIALRDVARATDTRTVIAALVPPEQSS